MLPSFTWEPLALNAHQSIDEFPTLFCPPPSSSSTTQPTQGYYLSSPSHISKVIQWLKDDPHWCTKVKPLALKGPLSLDLLQDCAHLIIKHDAPLCIDSDRVALPGALFQSIRLRVVASVSEFAPLLLSTLLMQVLNHLPKGGAHQAYWIQHADGGLDLTLQSKEGNWSVYLSGEPAIHTDESKDQSDLMAQNIKAFVSISATEFDTHDHVQLTTPLRSAQETQLTPWTTEQRRIWAKTLLLLIRACNHHGVARLSHESNIHSTASLHPTVDIAGEVKVGADTRIWHFSKLLGPLEIGERCSLGQNVVVERGVQIGNNVKIQNNVSIYSGVILEDDVFCGPSMVFTNVGTPRSHYPRRGQYQETRIGQGASIGANSTIVCGNRLGRYAFVGAGAVVTKDVPDYALVYGNPARVKGWACYCGATLDLKVDATQDPQEHTEETTECMDCHRRYHRLGFQVKEITS